MSLNKLQNEDVDSCIYANVEELSRKSVMRAGTHMVTTLHNVLIDLCKAPPFLLPPSLPPPPPPSLSLSLPLFPSLSPKKLGGDVIESIYTSVDLQSHHEQRLRTNNLDTKNKQI